MLQRPNAMGVEMRSRNPMTPIKQNDRLAQALSRLLRGLNDSLVDVFLFEMLEYYWNDIKYLNLIFNKKYDIIDSVFLNIYILLYKKLYLYVSIYFYL